MQRCRVIWCLVQSLPPSQITRLPDDEQLLNYYKAALLPHFRIEPTAIAMPSYVFPTSSPPPRPLPHPPIPSHGQVVSGDVMGNVQVWLVETGQLAFRCGKPLPRTRTYGDRFLVSTLAGERRTCPRSFFCFVVVRGHTGGGK